MSTTEPNDFACRLKAAMEERDLTVHALAAACGGAFSDRTIFRWRAGQSVPGIEALPILAIALGKSTDWLLGLEPHDQEATRA